jgi:hypothetical protein
MELHKKWCMLIMGDVVEHARCKCEIKMPIREGQLRARKVHK